MLEEKKLSELTKNASHTTPIQFVPHIVHKIHERYEKSVTSILIY